MLLRPNHSVPVQSKCQGWAAQGLGVAFYSWQSHVVICCDIWLWDVIGCSGCCVVGVHPVMLAERDAVPARPSTFRMDVLRLCPGHLLTVLTVLTVFPPILDAKSPDLLGNSMEFMLYWMLRGCSSHTSTIHMIWNTDAYGIFLGGVCDLEVSGEITVFQLHRMR